MTDSGTASLNWVIGSFVGISVGIAVLNGTLVALPYFVSAVIALAAITTLVVRVGDSIATAAAYRPEKLR